MRYLLVLIIVLLLALAWWPEPPLTPVEETFIGPQLEPLNKAKSLEHDYLDGLDKKKEQMEKQADGG